MSNTKTTQNYKNEDQRFEFVLYINNHIICQRYFHIPNFNEDSVNSLEMKELIDNIVGMNNGPIGMLGIIPNYFKKLSVDQAWNYFNPYVSQVEESGKNIFEKEDMFKFEIKVDKRAVAISQFSGNFFPTKVRYAVNIKEIIPEIMSEIKYFLSQKKYTKQYGEVFI
jgi:hypothetical protein